MGKGVNGDLADQRLLCQEFCADQFISGCQAQALAALGDAALGRTAFPRATAVASGTAVIDVKSASELRNRRETLQLPSQTPSC